MELPTSSWRFPPETFYIVFYALVFIQCGGCSYSNGRHANIYWLPICLYYGTLFLFNSDNGIITTSAKKKYIKLIVTSSDILLFSYSSSQGTTFEFSLSHHNKRRYFEFYLTHCRKPRILVSPVIWVFTNSSSHVTFWVVSDSLLHTHIFYVKFSYSSA